MTWSFLASILPQIFSIIAWILNAINASQEVKTQFQNLVKAAEDDMLIPAQARDAFADQDADESKTAHEGVEAPKG